MTEAKNLMEMQEYAKKQEYHAKFIADILTVYQTPTALFNALFVQKIFAKDDHHIDVGKQIQQSFKYALNTGENHFTTHALNKLFKDEVESRAPKAGGIKLDVRAETGYCNFDFETMQAAFEYRAKRPELGKSHIVYNLETDGINYPQLSLYSLANDRPLDIHVRIRLYPQASNGEWWSSVVTGNYLWNPDVFNSRKDYLGAISALKSLLIMSKNPQESFAKIKTAFQNCDQALQRAQQSANDRENWDQVADLLMPSKTPFEDLYQEAMGNVRSGMFSNKYKKKAKALAEALREMKTELLRSPYLFQIEEPEEYRQELFRLRKAFWKKYYRSGQRERFEKFIREVLEKRLKQDYQIHYHLQIVGASV